MIGDRLGKWVIFKELGRGGMGRVYLAQEEITGRQAAIKVLAAELAQEIGFLQRFQREIETLSKLEHPHIVRFFESGCENGIYFYAMEYVEGPSLEQMLEQQGRLPWKDVLSVALQVTLALRHVHDHGIIHRDLKPSNLIRDPKGNIKLTDFGIAKVFAGTHLTATGGVVGTAEFLSPEQAAGKVVGKRSDLYCLGCVLYALLTGQTPFSGNSYVELLHKHRYAQFDRPQKYIPDLPHEIDELICQLLEKDPDRRPRDAMVLYKQLDEICRKLERHSHRTSVDNHDSATEAENRVDKISAHDLPGPATLMSKLMREELEKQNRGGPVYRFLNRPVVLVVILLACVGALAWGLWPLDQEQLYQRGAKLMESDSLYDMQRAWNDYLDPLERRFPSHPYRKEVDDFRARWENAKAPQHSEAQRFYQQAETQFKQGDIAKARQTWGAIIAAFEEVNGEKEWVSRSRRALAEIDKTNQHKDRWTTVRAALDRAAELQKQGRALEAEQIRTSLEQLYRDDPSARDILAEIDRGRPK